MFKCFTKKKCDAKEQSNPFVKYYYEGCNCVWCIENLMLRHTNSSEDSLMDEIKQLREENKILKSQFDKSFDNSVEFAQTITKLEAENERLQQNVNNYKFRCYQQARQIDGLEKSLDQMVRDDIRNNPAIKQENDKLRAENEEISKQCLSAIGECRLSDLALKSAQKDIEELKSENEQLNFIKMDLLKLIAQRITTDEQLKVENQQLKAQLQQNQSEDSIQRFKNDFSKSADKVCNCVVNGQYNIDCKKCKRGVKI